jgi:hypothetical protein
MSREVPLVGHTNINIDDFMQRAGVRLYRIAKAGQQEYDVALVI